MVLVKLDIHMQKSEIGPLSYIIHKSHWKLIKDLSIISKNIKLIEKNKGEMFHNIGIDSDVLIWHQKYKQQKQK